MITPRLRIHSILALITVPFILANMLPASAFAKDSAYEKQRTTAGCQFESPADDYRPPPGTLVTHRFDWTGRCIDGMIEGFGELKRHREVVAGTIKFSTTQITRSHAVGGRLLGFGFETMEFGTSPVRRLRPRWVFNDWGDGQISFQGLGLDGNFQLLRNHRDFLPRRIVTVPTYEAGADAISIQLSDGNRSVTLAGGSCLLNTEDFPECVGPSAEAAARFQVFYIYQGGVRDVELPVHGNKNIKYCPEPRNVATCEPFIEPLTSDIVKSIGVRVNAFMDRLDASDTKVRSALREIGVPK